jgi:hypothetical protein
MNIYLFIACYAVGVILGFFSIIIVVGISYVGTFRIYLDPDNKNEILCDFDVPRKTFDDIQNKKWIVLDVKVVKK